jgi:hypothetical protein
LQHVIGKDSDVAPGELEGRDAEDALDAPLQEIALAVSVEPVVKVP